jgi:hypothetical protein
MKKNPLTDEAEELNKHLDKNPELVEEFRRLFLDPQSPPQSPRQETELSESTVGSAGTMDNAWVTGNDPSITCVEQLARGDVTHVYKVCPLT